MNLKRFIIIMIALIAAAAASIIPAATASASTKTTGNPSTGKRAIAISPGKTHSGGIGVVRAPGARPAAQPTLPGLKNLGSVYVVNHDQDTFAITVQPNNSGGRLANHLYMWTNNGWDTQTWTLWIDTNTNHYVFQSQYDGSKGGVAYGCMNVPNKSLDNVQLIVYSCAGTPSNERFEASPSCYSGAYYYCNLLTPEYAPYRAVAIGDNFPSNGAWVIMYSFNLSNWKEQWYWY